MAISNLQDKFEDELKDMYDAEHQFLEAQEEMLASANDSQIKKMLNTHIEQTEGHIDNLRKAFGHLNLEAQRKACDGAKGIVREGQKMLKETSAHPALCDTAILGGAAKAEHYEISSYRGLIEGAKLMGHTEVVTLLKQNLREEEETAQLIEKTEPMMLKKALSAAEPAASRR